MAPLVERERDDGDLGSAERVVDRAGGHALGTSRSSGATPALRYVTISGGSLPAAPFNRLSAQLEPQVAIHRTYGQSETFRSAIFLRAGDARSPAGRASVGRAVPGTQVHIARDRLDARGAR